MWTSRRRRGRPHFDRWEGGVHSFIQTISIAPLQVHFYSEALPTQHGYCAGVSRRSATGNCELRTCPRSIRGGWSGSRTHDPPVESYRLNQCAATSHNGYCKCYCMISNGKALNILYHIYSTMILQSIIYRTKHSSTR